jgi:hypothetical protein
MFIPGPERERVISNYNALFYKSHNTSNMRRNIPENKMVAARNHALPTAQNDEIPGTGALK